MRPFLIRVITLFLLAAPAQALDPQTTAQATIDAWKGWMAKHNVKRGAIAVSFDGAEIASDGINRSPDDPARLASLSKAITGLCTLRAMQAANMPLGTPISEVLSGFFAEHKPKDDRLPSVTVEHLLIQNSGIHTRYHRNIEVLRTFEKENKTWQMTKIAAEPLGGDPGRTKYKYTNANYLALGLVIEAVTGKDYETYCIDILLTPAGITTGKLSNRWRVLSAFGGWQMSARDYLKFIDTYLGGNQVMGQDPKTVPRALIGNGRFYGPGILMRPTGKGWNFWHNGGWKWRGRIKDDFGSYFAAYDNGWAVSINYSIDGLPEEWLELDTLVWKATHPQ